nr:hypothetical protein [Tanacetum cinerariifolium]
PNFKPKVLLRGSNSRNSLMSVYEEALPTKNSFYLLEVEDKDQSNEDVDINVQEELGNKVWPTLKEEVDILMEADPSYKDDDVEYEKDGIACDIKPEFDISVADNIKNGTRIIVGWDPNCVDVMVMELSTQAINCFIKPLNGDKSFHYSFIYAFVHTIDKRSLWKSLQKYKRSIQDALWVMLGYFNATLDPAKKSTSGSKVTTTIGDFRDCITDIEIKDIAMSGLRFTWNKKPVKKGGLLKKLDRIMSNKAKTEWLNEGGRNSKYFQNMVKGRQNRSRISVVENLNGIPFFGNDVGGQFESYFQNVLGRSYTVYPIEEPQSLFYKKISLTDATYMVRNNTTEEIKSALFDIDKNKAPGLDGFSSYFSDRLGLLLVMIYAKLSWNSLGLESCLKRGYARCAFNVDIQKAYDYVEWKFLESCLVNFGFHRIMIKWIMECVSSTSFSININGNIEDLNITHLYFTDDMMLFCHGDNFSVSVLKKALDEFRNVSGLLPSLTKSTVIFSNVKEATKAKILKIMPLSIGKLPARVRSLLRDHIVSRIGDGKDTSLWFDNWHPICPLSSFIYKRNIHYYGLSFHSKMADVIERRVWAWPKGLSDELDGLNVIEPPDLVEDRKYKLIWKTNNGRHKIFNVSIVWNDLRDGN